MRFTLPVVSLLVVLLSGGALARPADPQQPPQNATLLAMIAKRQTNRNEIQIRAHIKDTVKRVHEQFFEDDEVPENMERDVPAPVRERAALAVDERRSRVQLIQERDLDARSAYPKCRKTSARTGYAHYPGWKLVGDEVSALWSLL
jgi:hypothetical protein